MNWPAIFLGCFIVGFVLSALAFALGSLDFHLHIHVPFVHHVHLPPGQASHGAHAGMSPVNVATMMAFLAWFGGSGYLLTSRFGWLAVPALFGAGAFGVAGAAAVFWVMAHVLWSEHENMQSADSDMVGVLGRISQPIRENGIGELIYSHGGTRHSCGARSATGRPIARGVEVVVTGYDRGIACVQRWDDLAVNRS